MLNCDDSLEKKSGEIVCFYLQFQGTFHHQGTHSGRQGLEATDLIESMGKKQRACPFVFQREKEKRYEVGWVKNGERKSLVEDGGRETMIRTYSIKNYFQYEKERAINAFTLVLSLISVYTIQGLLPRGCSYLQLRWSFEYQLL